jgi:hypothetical protein
MRNMRNRKVAVPGLLIAAVAFAGACSDISPTEPASLDQITPSLFGGKAPNPADFAGGIDGEFVRIAQEVPGFGGFYFDEAGALTVVMAGDAQPMSGGALERSLQRLGFDSGVVPMRVQQGRYDFIQLNAMHRSVSPIFGINGVVYTDADERANRVRIGVEPAARADVERALGMLGIDRDAVIISDAEPIEPMQTTLRDRVRPIGGGLQIWRFIPPNQASACTLGFNVRAPNRPNVQGFVTNSHCTAQRGVVTPAEWAQKQIQLPFEPIAVEAHDLPFFQGGVCPAGRNCRYSDAAGAQYTVGPEEQAFGAIYRTLAPSQHGVGTLEIDPANPRWTITSETPFPVVGQTVHKTGRTTGWLIGPVINTCQTTNVSGAGEITILCQDRVEATPQGGDSGSPVYIRDGQTSNVSLVGILWGGSSNTYVFSSMQNVRFENVGPVNWITYPGQIPPPPSGIR